MPRHSKVSRLAHVPGIGVDRMGNAADAARDPALLRLKNLDTDIPPPAVALEVTRKAIGAYVIHKNQYLLLKRCSAYLRGTWQMVTGKVHEGEKAWETALREIREETGLIPDALYSADAVETFYYAVKDKVTCVPVFVAFVNGLQVQLAPSEHDAYEWLPYEEARERLVCAEQRRVITHIHEQFVLKEPQDIHRIRCHLC